MPRDDVKDANLQLLIELHRHFQQTDKLRSAFDRLLQLAGNLPLTESQPKATGRKENARA
jgi:hypothetical protein